MQASQGGCPRSGTIAQRFAIVCNLMHDLMFTFVYSFMMLSSFVIEIRISHEFCTVLETMILPVPVSFLHLTYLFIIHYICHDLIKFFLQWFVDIAETGILTFNLQNDLDTACANLISDKHTFF